MYKFYRNKSHAIFLSSSSIVMAASLAGIAPAYAAAEEAESADITANEIIVTAQRRSESLRKVPIAVTAITPETIENVNITTVDDIEAVTPGLVFDNGYMFPQMYIRGIGVVTSTPGLEQPVALYVDGSYMPRSNGTLFDMLDVSSVQVLKGPQGTLYGRNATGGAILVTTADPTNQFEGKASVEYGRFNHTRLEGVVNLPASDTVSFRFAGLYSHEDGFVKNLVTGKDVRGTDGYTLRAKMKWEPSAEFSAVLSGEYQHNSIKSGAAGRQAAPAPFCVPCAFGAPNAPGFYEVSEDLTITIPQRAKSIALKMDYEADDISLGSITTYRSIDWASASDVDHSALSLLGFRGWFGGKTFEQDFQASSSFGGMFDFLVGVQYIHDRAYARQSLFGGLFGIPKDVPENQQIYSDGIVTTESAAIFGELYVTPVENLKLTIGGRYSRDRRQNTATVSPLGLAFFAPAGSPSTFTEKTKYSKFTPRFVVAYDAGFVNLYASYTKGFKAGGLTNRYAAGGSPLGQENIESYEIGAKFESPDRRATVNVAAFLYNHKDVQVTVVNAAAGGSVNTNAASSRGKGIEIESSYQASDWLTLTGGLAYLDTEYRKYQNATVFLIATDAMGQPTGYVAGAEDLSGHRLPRAPKWTFIAGANINIPVGSSWTARLSPNLRHTSNYDFVIGAGGPARNDKQPNLTVVNLSGGVGPTSGDYEIGFYVDNLLDKKYYTHIATSTFGYEVYAAPPITYGLRLKARF